MKLTQDQQRLLWETFLEIRNKDETFKAAQQRSPNKFPLGITRAQVRDVLSSPPPENLTFPEPQVLFVDIETAPNVAAVWSFWKQNVAKNQIVNKWYMLSWAAAWNDGEVFGKSLLDYEPWNIGAFDDDYGLVSDLWDLLDAADVVVAHNGDRFDVPKVNSRMLFHGLNPPSPYQTVDTLKVLRNKFQFGSNRLDYIADTLGIELKGDAGGMETWMKCLEGDSDALQAMLDYNIQDIVVLRDLYEKISPWAPSHPNYGIITGQSRVCSHCGSDDLTLETKPYRTNASAFRVWRCNDCGAQSREKQTIIDKDVRKDILVPLAR